jgi:hypothetical protein
VTVIRQLMDASSRTGCSMAGEEPRQAQRLMHALQHPPGIASCGSPLGGQRSPSPLSRAATPRSEAAIHGQADAAADFPGKVIEQASHIPGQRCTMDRSGLDSYQVLVHTRSSWKILWLGASREFFYRQQSTLGSSSVRSVFGHYVAPARGRLRHAPCRLTYRTPNSSNAGLEHGRRPSRHHHENIKLPSEHCDALRCACSAGRNSSWQGGAVSQINHSVSGFSACQAQIAPLPILKTVPRSSRVACRSCGRVSFLNGLIGGGEKRIGQEHRQERRQEET